MDFDFDNSSEDEFYDSIDNKIDKFISDETDYILDLYYELKDKFPYFLDKMSFHNLLTFIINNKFTNVITKRYNPNTLDYFYSEYSSEITATLSIINQYLSKYKKFQLNFDTYIQFACYYTTIIPL